jgi:zinc/manganese transport system permease protein
MLELMLVPLVAALVLVGIHAYLGVHVIARGVIFVDLALAQMAALGYTAATLVGMEAGSTGAYAIGVGATLLGALILSFTRFEHEFITQEALIGILFVTASAATILLAAQAPRGAEHVEELLTGTLLWVTWSDIVRISAIYLVLGLIYWTLRRRFLTISLLPAEARAKGWRLGWWDFVFYALFGVVVTVSVAVAGVLLVFSFLVMPAVIAFLFTSRTGPLLGIAWASGTAATVLGLVVSFSYDLPTGPVVVCAFALTVLLAFVVRRTWGGPRGAGREP